MRDSVDDIQVPGEQGLYQERDFLWWVLQVIIERDRDGVPSPAYSCNQGAVLTIVAR